MISRRTLFAALAARHFGNGSPTWRIGRGNHGSVPATPSRTLTTSANSWSPSSTGSGNITNSPPLSNSPESCAAVAATSPVRVAPAQGACAAFNGSASRSD